MKKLNLFSINIIIYLYIIIITKTVFIENNKTFSIIKSNEDFNKPKIKLNVEFQLIKMKNGMIGLLIYDPYSTISHVHFQVEGGCYIDATPSISHLEEHMIFQGSENYPKCFPILKTIGGMKLYSGGAITGQTNQEYFYTIPNNLKFDEGLKVIVDAFKHPLYLKETIKKEIQPLNSEFYFTINEEYHLLDAIIRQLSSNKTSFKGFTSGNNITLNPNDCENLSKKIKSYHNLINKPENLFFLFYSNQTIKDLEKYAEKYLNYKMYKFPENETDKLEEEQLLKNLKSFEKYEIFDDNLYEHGMFYNSHNKKNILNIFFYVGDVDFKDLQFDLFEYYSYLFKSESLMNILKSKNYISTIYSFEISGSILIQNNNVFSINLELTENGLNNLDEVLLIIYKYIDIMKKEGYKQKYFNNFIKFREDQNNKDFQIEMFNILTTFSSMIESYRFYGVNQIFNYGTPSLESFNETKLKTYLSNLRYEKSFFIINSLPKVTELKTFLDSVEIKKLEYYNVDYLYGIIPNKLKKKILDNNLKYDNLFMRNINPYFCEKYEKDIPCFNHKINNCKELNEFDYESEDKYKGTLLEDNKNYITYYQIDKSSETFLVNSYIDIKFIENKNITTEIIDIIKFYINDKLSIINEVPTISIVKFDQTSIAFKIQCFTDNIKKIFKDFFTYIRQELQEGLFNYSKISIKSQNIEKDNVLFRDYIFGIGNKFMGGGVNPKPNIKDIIDKIDNINFGEFIHIYNYVFNKIIFINFKIAGNINKNLVQELHDNLKESFKIFFEEKNNLKTCKDNNELEQEEN